MTHRSAGLCAGLCAGLLLAGAVHAQETAAASATPNAIVPEAAHLFDG